VTGIKQLVGAFGCGALAATAIFAWPFSTSTGDVADRLMAYRKEQGFAPLSAACHLRPGYENDWFCEVEEAVNDPEASGWEEYLVTREGGKWRFQRITQPA
jgi:hypothetical protein